MTRPRSARAEAAEAIVRSIRTGERTAGDVAATHLASGVTFVAPDGVWTGRADVAERISGQWVFTPVYARGVWSTPLDETDAVVVTAAFPSLGASPRDYTLRVEFDDDDLVTRIEEQYTFPTVGDPGESLPDHVASAINRALQNSTPIVLAYVGADGAPSLSLRGSVQVFGSLELCFWSRKPSGGVVAAVASDPRVSLLYRDSSTRTTFVMTGRARVATDDETRQRVFDAIPEVERNHDPERRGVPVIIELDRVAGTSPSGPVLVQR